MRPNTMRAVDYWIGIPICFALTLTYKLCRLLGMKDPEYRTPPKNILLIELVEMGTIVVAYPALEKLKEIYPDAKLHFLLFASVRPSLEVLGAIEPDNILTIDASSASTLVRDTLRFIWLARKRGIDTILNLEHFVRYSSMLSYISGARKRVGYHRFSQEGIYCGDFLTHKVSYNPHIHTAHTFLDLVAALSAPPNQSPAVKRSWLDDELSVPIVTNDPAIESRVIEKIQKINPSFNQDKKLVIVNPNASKLFLMRKLPLENYAELVQKLLEDPDVYVGITGVEEEKADAEFICTHVGDPRAMDLTGATTLEELLYVFNLADVLVTNDSGPAHFACLTNVHIVALFGPELPSRYRPLSPRSDVVYSDYSCSPCVSPFNQRRTPCNDNLCMKAISVDDICQLVRTRVAERTGAIS